MVVEVVMPASASAGTHPSKNRKIPLRAVSVRTVLVWRIRDLEICWSHSTKKNVLFWTIGPPMLIVYSLRLNQFGCVGFQTPLTTSLLFPHVFASRALLDTLHTAAPEYLLVPERVLI